MSIGNIKKYREHKDQLAQENDWGNIGLNVCHEYL